MHRAILVFRLCAGLLGLAALGFSAVAMAQQDPLSSDHPGFANAAQSAPKNRLITEFRVTTSPFASNPTVGLPRSSFRFGVTDWLELRWRAPHLEMKAKKREGAKPELVMNLVDPIMGFKIAGSVSDQLAISTVSEVTLPMGSGRDGGVRAGWSSDVNVEWYATDRLTIVPNMLVASEWVGTRDQGLRRMAAAVSLAVWWQFTPKLGAFTLFYSWFRKHQPGNLQVGTGMSWRVRPYASLYGSVKVPVIQDSRSAVIGVGTTWYWQGWRESR